MNNFEAIKNMTPQQMEIFLDNVLLTGFNLVSYAASMEDGTDEQMDALDTNPYNSEWLSREAEDATRFGFADDGDTYLPDALCDAIMKATGIRANDE